MAAHQGDLSMDAVILAGGFAKRMWPLTKDKPKQLLPIAGRPMLSYTIDKVLEMDAVERVYVSTNEAFSGQFREFLASYGDDRLELFVEPSLSEERKMGSVGGLGYLIDKKGLGGDTFIIGGDNLFTFHPREALAQFRREGMDLIAVFDVRTKELAKLYGIVNVDDKGIIREFIEKPEEPTSTLAATAFYIFKAETLGMVIDYLKRGGRRDALGHFISHLYKHKPVYAWRLPGAWFDIGSLEVYEEADGFFRGRKGVSGSQ